MKYYITTKDTPFDAVILGAGDFPSNSIPLTILERAPYICCCDGAGATLMRHGVMPDAIIGDGDSLDEEFKKKNANIIHLVHEQDDNDLTKATRFCLNNGLTNIAYLGATGKREDHTIANISLMLTYKNKWGISPTMITDYGYFVPAKGNNEFETFKGQQVSIFNVSCTRLAATGLRWEPYVFEHLWQGALNEATGQHVIFECNGDYIVFLTHEAKEKV